MSTAFHVDPYDLLGQAELYPPHIFLPGEVQPKLEIAWGSFHQGFLSNVAASFQRTHLLKAVHLTFVFRDCRVEWGFPRRAVLAAALLHIAFVLLPWPNLPAAPRRNPAFDNTELTWSGPIEDLPLLNVPRAKAATQPKSEPDPPPAEPSVDAFHPRQRIFTDPVHPTHPRQTLINPAAPAEAPKFLPALPNMVQLAASQAPARPRIEISEQALAKLHPHKAKTVAVTDTPSPDLPNLEQRPAEISLAATHTGPAKPKLEINAGSTPRVTSRTQTGDTPAPEVPAVPSGVNGGAPSTLIALSANPAPPAPLVPVPQGNLAARVAMSPEGKPGATGNSQGSTKSGHGDSAGNDTSGAGKSDIGISISGGSPKPNANSTGLGGALKLSLPKTQSGLKRPDSNSAADDPPERVGPPNFAALPPGAKPELVFASHRIYSMNINMPNLNSATGSWIIHFSELHLGGSAAHRLGEINAPVALRKVDPKYPQTLVQDHVEGEVILYGVIRLDGTVDSIQLVRGIDPQLDAYAIEAFAQWKFQPATREGQPVDLEAIVYIPFRGPERR
ncbi:MAG TPA: TonB family protein [Verrucomicrobiae bacterium]|nr:TonB family protein [Verrucomicrobiae bacterium]